jgi:uncharacterized protein (DUF1697 family)
MPVLVSLLRGINVGGHNLIRMEALRAVYESLGLQDSQTYVQSGNVVFRTQDRNFPRIAKQIEGAIERTFGFRPAVIVRTPAELKDVIATNPFAERRGIEPNKLLVVFLAGSPDENARAKVLAIKTDPEELRMQGREVYMYFPDGMARPKLTWMAIEKMLKIPATARNWNTVTKLLEMAVTLDSKR